MNSPTRNVPRLSPLAWALLRYLTDTPCAGAPGDVLQWRKVNECERVAERLFPDASLTRVIVATMAALCSLEKQGVVQLHRPKGTAVVMAAAKRTLPAVTRAALLLSKPCKRTRHARKVQGQPEHQQRGAAVPVEPAANSRGPAASDHGPIQRASAIPNGVRAGAGGASGQAAAGGGSVSPSPTEETASDAVLAAPESANDGGPVVETVQIDAPAKDRRALEGTA